MSFGCYGTLIDWETDISDALIPWVRAHDLSVDDQQLLGAHGGASIVLGNLKRRTRTFPRVIARRRVTTP